MQKATPPRIKKKRQKKLRAEKVAPKRKEYKRAYMVDFGGAVGSWGIVGEVNRAKTQRHAKWACQSVSHSDYRQNTLRKINYAVLKYCNLKFGNFAIKYLLI